MNKSQYSYRGCRPTFWAMCAFPLILLLSTLIRTESLNAQSRADALIHYRVIAGLVEQGNVAALAELVVYPLHRPNPLRDIRTNEVFVRYYPILFDSAFRHQLKGWDSSDLFEHHGNFGLFAGDIWIDEDGKIVAINHTSPVELELKELMTQRIKEAMHPSIRDWKNNLLVYHCSGDTLRIDETSRGLRLVSWTGGCPTSLAPDLILHGGAREVYGTQGGVGYTFRNGEWTYRVQRLDICAEGEMCGPIVSVLRNGKVVSRFECTEGK